MVVGVLNAILIEPSKYIFSNVPQIVHQLKMSCYFGLYLFYEREF